LSTAGTAGKVDQTKSSIKRNANTTTNNESPQNNRKRKQMPQLICELSALAGNHHNKTERDAQFLPKATKNEISQPLKEFTVYFLLNGKKQICNHKSDVLPSKPRFHIFSSNKGTTPLLVNYIFS
jgi:hypothetical protein